MTAQPNLISGIFFELYDRRLGAGAQQHIPLADVGILYQALNSQIMPGQRVQLEISDEADSGDSPCIEVNFEILERIDPSTNEAAPGRTWGPYSTDSDSILELHSPFSNVYVNAHTITVELGDGIIQQIGAPTELSVESLLVSAKQVLSQSSGADGPEELRTVALFAREAACDGVQTVAVRDADLSVSWPGAVVYPWNKYAVAVPAAPDDVTFMRRRLRRILTAFRSHSKGALVRLAAKIDHSRMTKDSRGVALVNKLKADQIIVPFDAGKFYRLNQDLMGRVLGVGYHDLAQQRFTPESDSYLADVLARIR